MLIKKNTKIATANSLFRQRNYVGALKVYEAVTNINPVLAKSLQFNIDQCKRKNTIHGFETISSTRGDCRIEPIENLLSAPLQILRKVKCLPKNAYILEMVSSCQARKIIPNHLYSAVVCGLASPFQRDLLWYISSLAHKLGLANLFSDNTSGNSVSLATLVTLASSTKEWLLNRHRVQQSLKQFSDDTRLWDLLNNPPDETLEEGALLPKFRSEYDDYSWESPRQNWEKRQTKSIGSIAIGSILLNESKFICLNLLQHYDMCDEWILVEGACKGYPPRKVSLEGLSLDNCATHIRIFPDPQHKIRLVQHGWTKSTGEDAKSELRNRYMRHCNSDFLWVVDIDEFYESEDINAAIQHLSDDSIQAVTLPQVHLWKNISRFITGDYYDVSHTRIYRHQRGMRYVSNHNFPEIGGKFTYKDGHKKIQRMIIEAKVSGFDYVGARCVHMGFAKDADDMRDKSDYYVNRGEDVTRKVTTKSRSAWFSGDLPDNCKLRVWGGRLPEVLNSCSGDGT